MNDDKYNLLRFIEAQESYGIYDIALGELERGRKRSHWVWFVFPQMKGLGYSYNSNYYGITCREEAEAYLENKILNERLKKECLEVCYQGKRMKRAWICYSEEGRVLSLFSQLLE